MSLKDRLIARIDREGPLSLAAYMEACLLDPTEGYYTTRDPLGAAGDFTTAPEISQMFGELIGLALAQAWLDQGAPNPFTLAELGPGRGTLMADILRATKSVPGFHAAARITLVEASPVLQSRQQDTLAGREVTWLREARALAQNPLFLVANEFFDALPIAQFEHIDGIWRERRVGLHGGALAFVPSGPVQDDRLKSRRVRDGDIVELRPAANAIMTEIAQRLIDHGGAALIIDYGDWEAVGDTFQALSGHARVDPFADPGTADLTAHVDFTSLTPPGVQASAPCTQGVFLERLGITARAQTLARGLSGAALETHIAAHRRLTHPQEMGTLFKVLGLTPHGTPMLPGLET